MQAADYLLSLVISMKIEQNISLRPYNSFGIDARANEYTEFSSAEELRHLIEAGRLSDKGHLILGGGSNILFTGDYEGLVIRNCVMGIELEDKGNRKVLVTAGAGIVWDELVHFCIGKGLGGIENLVLIPGSVGAGPIQNIGAYGAELADTFHSLDAVELATGKLRTFTRDECGFGYRNSIFKQHARGAFAIVRVRLLLSTDHEPDTSYGSVREELLQAGVKDPGIREVAEAIKSIRRSKLPDPEVIGNAGSFFKNPVISRRQFADLQMHFPDIPFYPAGDELVKVPAGWMIEQCGWKGRSVGNAAVHDRQALVLVNTGNANGMEVLELAKSIHRSVSEDFGIELETEVNII